MPTVAALFARLVLACNLFIGCAWLLGHPRRTMTPAYLPARKLASDVFHLPGDPAHWWGGVLIILSVVALGFLFTGNDLGLRLSAAALTTQWIFWAFLFGYAAVSDENGGIASVGFAVMCILGSARPIFASDTIGPHR